MNVSVISDRINHYKKRKSDFDKGYFKPVPFANFPKLKKYIPGIIPGIMYKVTSHSGMGKTKFSKFMFVYQPMIYCIKNNIDYKVLYISPEETRDEFIDDLFKHVVRRKLGIDLDRFAMNGYAQKSLTQAELKSIEDCAAEAKALAANIEVVDDAYTATSIYERCRQFAKENGRFVTDAKGREKYIKSNPDQVVLVVLDHISLLTEEFDKKSGEYLNQRRCISKWHTDICKRVITKSWGWAVLNVQQQSLESEKQVFTSRGDTVTNKLLPSMDGLGENRTVSRDDYVIMGLFSPEKYEIENYKGYDIEKLGDNFRSLHLIKNRFGAPNKILPMYFDGKYTHFEELPYVGDVLLEKFYKKAQKT